MTEAKRNQEINQRLANLFESNLQLLEDGAADVLNAARKPAIEAFRKQGIPDFKTENYFRFLRSSSVIEVYQRFPVNLLIEDGKILSNFPEIETHSVNKIIEPGIKHRDANSRLCFVLSAKAKNRYFLC